MVQARPQLLKASVIVLALKAQELAKQVSPVVEQGKHLVLRKLGPIRVRVDP